MTKVRRRKKPGKFTPGRFSFRVGRSAAGLGLYTRGPIPKGACIIEYKGRQISEAEEYTIRSKYLFKVTEKKTINGPPRINLAGYINHSCRPNCEVAIWRGHVWIMAKRAIDEGEELAYDYGKEYWNEYIKPKGCRCPKCRGLPPGRKGRARTAPAFR